MSVLHHFILKMDYPWFLDTEIDFLNILFTDAETDNVKNKGLFVKTSTNENVSEVDKEIEKVLKMFEQTNRKEVPSYIQKLSVFNKPYFHGVFVPR